MAQEDVEEPRPVSASTTPDTIVDEQSGLLSCGNEVSLYRTISRRSDAQDLPPDDEDLEIQKNNLTRIKTASGVYATISVLLLGAFLANVDASLVLATYGRIASEFHDLDSGSWILSAFILAQCTAQPLYGKLADIYGRKAYLQTSYVLFALGTCGTGFARTIIEVIVWRAVQGAGSAGMTSLVAVIITDLVPIHEVATLRSYVNILQTTGRMAGGIIGGALTYALGWRAAFFIQIPPTVFAIVLVQWRLDLPKRESSGMTHYQKLKRIDFLGSIFLCSSIFCACFILETGGQKYPWNSSPISITAGVGVFSLLAFVVSATRVAEPIFPLKIMAQRVVITNYSIGFLQVLNQFGLMTMVPLYFMATARSNTAQAGAYLIPAFFGNTIGGTVAGYFIKRTGLYKPVSVLSPLFSILAMSLCYFTWQGHTSIFGSLAILPGGFAAGMLSSSIFVGLAAGVKEEEMAIAASGLYLFFNLGAIAGASAGAAVYQSSLRKGLENALQGVTGGREIMQKALSDITYVQTASDQIRELILPAYVYGLHQVNLQGIACAVLCFIIAIFIQQKRILKKK